MLQLIVEKVTSGQFLLSVLIALAAAASVLTIAMPYIEGDPLTERMKLVGEERDRLRQESKQHLNKSSNSLRPAPKAYMRDIVERFNLAKWLSTADAKKILAKAGFRGANAQTTFLFFRLIAPIALLFLGLFLIFTKYADYSNVIKCGILVGSVYLGIKAPEIFLSNITKKRQLSIKRAFPNALDLLLICVESGMSIEHAFRKVGFEISEQSIPLAEEMALTTAELSFLPDRRLAYENMVERIGLDTVKAISIALVQAEKFGTPLGAALRNVADEARETRLMEAEKKAAALPPKLTVPLIVFLLPVLFVVVGGNAAIHVSRVLNHS